VGRLRSIAAEEVGNRHQTRDEREEKRPRSWMPWAERPRGSEFPDTFRFGLLLARHANTQYGGHLYVEAQNLRRQAGRRV
jgi:hypothetical protein